MQSHDGLVKLFVGQIPPDVGEEELKAVFIDFGDVKESIILKNRANGMSKGAGFIKYATKEEAMAAITALHEVRTLGSHHKAMQVKFADGEPSTIFEGTFRTLLMSLFRNSYLCTYGGGRSQTFCRPATLQRNRG